MLTVNRSAYKVLKIGLANATRREKTTFEKLAFAAAHSEHRGSICVRQPERIFDFEAKGQDFNVFVFEPLGPNLLEYTNQPSKRPFGSLPERSSNCRVSIARHGLSPRKWHRAHW